MKATIIKIGSGIVALFLPVLAFAAEPQNATLGGGTGGYDLLGVIRSIGALIQLGVPVILTLAVVFFLYALLKYLMGEGANKDAARNQMIWGIVAIAVMVSVWGLVGILQSTFGISGSDKAKNINLPQLK